MWYRLIAFVNRVCFLVLVKLSLCVLFSHREKINALLTCGGEEKKQTLCLGKILTGRQMWQSGHLQYYYLTKCHVFFSFAALTESAAELAEGWNILDHMDHIVYPAVILFPQNFHINCRKWDNIRSCRHVCTNSKWWKMLGIMKTLHNLETLLPVSIFYFLADLFSEPSHHHPTFGHTADTLSWQIMWGLWGHIFQYENSR